jgi:hypothetical protein
MEEALWYMQQQSRVLQEFRANIRPMWDDEAARTINLRMLDPHQELDADMVAGFNNQRESILVCNQTRAAAMESAGAATECSEQIRTYFEQIDEDIEVSLQFEGQYRSFYAESSAMLPEVDQFLQQANRIGEGAPPRER